MKPPSSVGLWFEDLGLPALGLGVVLVHLEQVAGEQRRLVAAGAGADFHDARASGWRPRRRRSGPAARSTAPRARRAAAGSSASASSRISASSPAIICCASAIWPVICLNLRYFLASLPSEPCSRATAVIRAGFDSTSGLMRSCSSCRSEPVFVRVVRAWKYQPRAERQMRRSCSRRKFYLGVGEAATPARSAPRTRDTATRDAVAQLGTLGSG